MEDDNVSDFKVDAADLEKDLAISQASMNDSMANQASLYAKWARIGSNASRLRDRAKLQIELVEARLDAEIRQDAADAGRKITEKTIESQVKATDEWQAAMNNWINAKANAAMADDAREALKQKRDMLIQIGADLRQEYKGNVVVRDRMLDRMAETTPQQGNAA